MADQTTQPEARLTRELNDLLQLDHDAMHAYGLAIEHLESSSLRETLSRFRGDHERHITELGQQIRAQGGVPIEIGNIPTGFFKLAVQRVSAADDDREILLAFKPNERQVRDSYRRQAEQAHEPDVTDMLRRAAADEERHYNWVLDTLESLGRGSDAIVARAASAPEQRHQRAADGAAVEGRNRADVEGVLRNRADVARRELEDAGDRVRSTAAGRLESVAEATDRAGARAEQKGGVVSRTAPLAHRIADGLDDAAGYLRAGDLQSMRTDLERQIELHPVRSMLIAIGAGLLIGRTLR